MIKYTHTEKQTDVCSRMRIFFEQEDLMKKFIRIIASVITAALLGVSIAAEEPIDIRLNGEETGIDALLLGTTTYVPFEAANELLSFGTAEVTGSPEAMTAVAADVSVSARAGDCYVEASGRYIGGSDSVMIRGMLYVPIRSIAKAYGTEVVWQDATRSVDLYSTDEVITPGEAFYDADEVFWLARIIQAESGGEPMKGKILVGNVVMNRVLSSAFPNTIYGVIFDRKYGVQFTPIINGSIYNTPSEESIIAAKLCLDSYYISRAALYFLNPVIAQNFWVPANRPYLTTVGCHDFYA